LRVPQLRLQTEHIGHVRRHSVDHLLDATGKNDQVIVRPLILNYGEVVLWALRQSWAIKAALAGRMAKSSLFRMILHHEGCFICVGHVPSMANSSTGFGLTRGNAASF